MLSGRQQRAANRHRLCGSGRTTRTCLLCAVFCAVKRTPNRLHRSSWALDVIDGRFCSAGSAFVVAVATAAPPPPRSSTHFAQSSGDGNPAPDHLHSRKSASSPGGASPALSTCEMIAATFCVSCAASAADWTPAAASCCSTAASTGTLWPLASLATPAPSPPSLWPVVMDGVKEPPAGVVVRVFLTGEFSASFLSGTDSTCRRENKRWIMSVRVCSAHRRSSSLNRISKQILKHVCISSHTASLLMHDPTGVSNRVRNTCAHERTGGVRGVPPQKEPRAGEACCDKRNASACGAPGARRAADNVRLPRRTAWRKVCGVCVCVCVCVCGRCNAHGARAGCTQADCMRRRAHLQDLHEHHFVASQISPHEFGVCDRVRYAFDAACGVRGRRICRWARGIKAR